MNRNTYTKGTLSNADIQINSVLFNPLNANESLSY